MKTIWKWTLQITGLQGLEMPEGAEILCVQTQSGMPQLWALVDPSLPKESRSFVIFGTGHKVPDEHGRYIGTFQVQGGDLVFHVFEV